MSFFKKSWNCTRRSGSCNRPFPNFFKPLPQRESWGSSFHITLPSRPRHPRIFLAPLEYIEMHHVRPFFSVWRHGICVLRDVRSQRVYLQEESLPPFLSCRMHLKNRSEFVLIIFYLQLINSGHADSSMADKKHGKLSS